MMQRTPFSLVMQKGTMNSCKKMDIRISKMNKRLPEAGTDLLPLISLRDPSQQQWRMGSSKNHKNIGKDF